jgi:RimJ/RimL family protein N-acetyltransferase
MSSKNLNKLTVREAVEEDLQLYYIWANDPEVRASSFHSDPISPEDHGKWFIGRLRDPDCSMYVFEMDDKAAGQVRIEKQGKAIISISIDKQFRGKGLSSLMLEQAVQLFKKENDQTIFAYIKPGNQASIHSFTKAGFRFSGTDRVNNIECEVYTI